MNQGLKQAGHVAAIRSWRADYLADVLNRVDELHHLGSARPVTVALAHFDECGQGIRLIADVSPREAGQQSDDAGQCLPSTMVMRSGLCRCVKWGAFGGGFAQALACEGEAMGVVHEPVEDGVGNGWIGDHVVPMLHIDLAGDDG